MTNHGAGSDLITTAGKSARHVTRQPPAVGVSPWLLEPAAFKPFAFVTTARSTPSLSDPCDSLPHVRILIIYEEVPESTKFYTMDVTGDQWDRLKLTHGCFVNGADNTDDVEAALTALAELLVDHPQLDSTSPIDVRGFDYVLWTGFFL